MPGVCKSFCEEYRSTLGDPENFGLFLSHFQLLPSVKNYPPTFSRMCYIQHLKSTLGDPENLLHYQLAGCIISSKKNVSLSVCIQCAAIMQKLITVIYNKKNNTQQIDIDILRDPLLNIASMGLLGFILILPSQGRKLLIYVIVIAQWQGFMAVNRRSLRAKLKDEVCLLQS